MKSAFIVASLAVLAAVCSLSSAAEQTCQSCPVADCGQELCKTATAPKQAPCAGVAGNPNKTACGTCRESYCSKAIAFFCTSDGRVDTNCTADDDIKAFRNASTACWKWFEGQCGKAVANATVNEAVNNATSTNVTVPAPIRNLISTTAGTTTAATATTVAVKNATQAGGSATTASRANATTTVGAAEAAAAKQSGAILTSSCLAFLTSSALALVARQFF